jgi:hypothetical protein
MRKPLFPVLLATLLFSGLPAHSQSPQSPASAPITIDKVEAAFFESPMITAGSYRKARQGQATPWLEIDVKFDHGNANAPGPKVADSLTVNYYIVLNNAAIKTVNPDGKPTILTGSVTHADVPYGRGLRSAAFVSPQTLFRYFDGKVPVTTSQAIADVGVTISDSTGVAAIGAYKNKPDAARPWWDETGAYSQVTGRVMDKASTPFAALAWDYYLPPKPKSAP